MGIKHKKYNTHGVQFHPESIKTIHGLKILKNFYKEYIFNVIYLEIFNN